MPRVKHAQLHEQISVRVSALKPLVRLIFSSVITRYYLEKDIFQLFLFPQMCLAIVPVSDYNISS